MDIDSHPRALDSETCRPGGSTPRFLASVFILMTGCAHGPHQTLSTDDPSAPGMRGAAATQFPSTHAEIVQPTVEWLAASANEAEDQCGRSLVGDDLTVTSAETLIRALRPQIAQLGTRCSINAWRVTNGGLDVFRLLLDDARAPGQILGRAQSHFAAGETIAVVLLGAREGNDPFAWSLMVIGASGLIAEARSMPVGFAQEYVGRCPQELRVYMPQSGILRRIGTAPYHLLLMCWSWNGPGTEIRGSSAGESEIDNSILIAPDASSGSQPEEWRNPCFRLFLEAE